MKVKATVIDDILAPLRLYVQKDFTRQEVNENPPLRAELFSTEQMEQHALQLASHHAISYELSAELLLKELSDNEKILFHVNGLLQKSVKEKKPVSPAAEWMLDNFYLIEDQIRIAKRHLPKGYSKGLPKLKNGSLAGFPRVYSIAIEIIAHSDGHIDIDRLQNFLTAYQKEQYLTLGELWAIPIMLRLALIENLSRVAARIAVDRTDSALANKWARQIIDTAENKPKDLVLAIADMARSNPPMVSSFVAEFARKLQWKGTELTLPLQWIEQQLSGTNETINSMVLIENQSQAADQVSVSNSINSLRFLAKTDWRDFVENMSVVEHTLRRDIHGVYTNMDFHTRDHYRHTIEKVANNSGLSETDVARIAIDLARKSATEKPEDKRRAHVGYYLLEDGLEQTELATRVHLSFWKRVQKNLEKYSGGIYSLTALLITFLIGGAMVLLAADSVNRGLLVAVGLLSLISASHFALSMANWLSTLWIKPTPLPKMNFSKGIPEEYRTMVVVPTILISQAQVEKLVEELEVRFLSNRDANLFFGLLTDFRDAPLEVMPDDHDLIRFAQEKIIELNSRYHRETNDTFFLFHRPRSWNRVDKIWMGYERKRGKLSSLNHLLRGKSPENFSVIVGEEDVYRTVRYIITLDSDTQLPREAAWKLVGLMAHPLNQPQFDAAQQCVTAGYSIIQPRIAISLHGATRSGFTRLHENDSGIDPYTRVTSDVYQDLFGEGSFIGKGIYDIDAFEKVLDERFPENRILSHDLLEGSYARCGFASDIQFYEDYPSRYQIDINRRHRWIRGDWQIVNWILPFVPGPYGQSERNPISTLSRWKIFDNLRRSLIPIAHVLLLLAGWTLLSFSWIWTLIILAIMLLPAVLTSLWSSTRKPREIGLTQHINNTVGVTSRSILQSVFAFVCLPYEAFVSLDAISKTAWRVLISRKKLLEWNPFGFSQKQKAGIFNTYRTMWPAPVLSVGILLLIFYAGSMTPLLIATPFLILWILSPAIVSFIDKPLASTKTKITSSQEIYLRELARKSWSFFENLVGSDDNWLPPDNLQQYPIPVLAHRTSPTNIGLSILANLTACDFGYATTSQLIERTKGTFNTLQKLERYQGHFYNWYDTQTLDVLNPRYISAVDSGNLAGHLLTFRQGLLAIPQQKIVEQKIIHGLQDTLRLSIQEIATNEHGLRTALLNLHDSLAESRAQLPAFKKHLEASLVQYQNLISTFTPQQNGWVSTFEKQLKGVLDEISLFTPWVNGYPIPEKFKDWKIVTRIPTLEEVAEMDREIKSEIIKLHVPDNSREEAQWLAHMERSVAQASELARARIETLEFLAKQSTQFAEMEYDFLYDKSQHLLAIGYHVPEHHRDLSYYDLLASEARLSSFVAIAQGKIPQENWFALGRRLTTAGNTPVLLSWSGSMFEYLMPGLVMPTYKNTLLDQMCIGSVLKQVEYGTQQGVPWGISESCYNLVDTHLTYQYRAFGIPHLGFKRGLGQDLVIAPYATILALMVDPKAACGNLEKMKEKGFEGQYGFYEAIDYTPIRLAREQRYAIIKTFMAHHQGMSLLALAYLLLDQPMQKRFEADTQFQTALLLLQEQVPKSVGFYAGSSDHEEISPVSIASEIRVIKSVDTPVPEVQLLSNGHYYVMISNAGGGYSRWRELSVTRWREDTTCDNWGSFCFINDRDKNQFWSTTYQPTLKKADHYEAIFSQGKVEFRRHDDHIEAHTVVIVSPEDDVEVRRTQLINHSTKKRNLSVTSYGEVVLATSAGDDSHPSFSNLFVQTEINEHQHAIICTRRPRSKDERPPWMFHLMKVNGTEPTEISYETDRTKFIGRGSTLVHPQIMNQTKPLSGSQGSVLDPIVAIQYKITLEPGETACIDMVTGIAETKEFNQSLIDKYQDRHLRDRAFELSWTHSQVVLRQIGATEADAQLYGKLASSILYMNPALRAQPSIVLKNQRQQSALWSYSISGDLPIVLLIISNSENISLVRQLIKAKAYWQMKGLAVDLVIINEDPGGYRQVLQDQIQGLIAAGIGIPSTEKQGRIFVRPTDQVTAEDRMLFHAIARVIISDKKGTMEEQVNKRFIIKPPTPKLSSGKTYPYKNRKPAVPYDLQYFNGTGGFSADGKEYVIITQPKNRTPLPWINVIANPQFGTIVSENGSSYTWFENAHEFRLTPWKNDPVLDSSGEVFYIRDEESGGYWSVLGLPSSHTLITRHGFGYSTFECIHDEIHTETCVHVDRESPIKFVSVTITNRSDRLRKLTSTGFIEWVVGDLRSKTAMHISTEFDSANRALFARNRYQADFQHHVGFLSVDEGSYTYSTDRAEFIGRNGTLQHPEALNNAHLSGKTGACLDACGAIQVALDLEPGKSKKVIFKIGAGKSSQDAIATLNKFKGSETVANSLNQVKQFWNNTLGVVQVETPDTSINLLANGWLLYQVLSCRLWGRTGFYQSGGAFGFRDQLQDVLALVHMQPALMRHQIVLCASRQFKDGDVQHWWHPPTGRGVRTRCSDDFLWLPFVTSRYLAATNDLSILNESVSFLQGRKLNEEEESYYDLPLISDRQATVYEHCKQSILHILHFGDHGLPLMGSGDWNDGMNMVGIHGKGESIWLAFFLYDVLNRFTKVAAHVGDQEFVTKCQKLARQLRKNINAHAWDGEWYLRAFFDDGSPLGSKNNIECSIDAISQSWSVLSGAGETERSRSAMRAVNSFLINREKGLIQLLDPPFDTSDMDPGYIKGYVPGVRENGGQYTHAAIWIIMAFAKMGDHEKTAELLKMINPIHHGSTPEGVAIYKVEPYVIAADVYGVEPHTGRGGWTWYTGSAGWMYQLILESFLGLTREGDKLRFQPCIPGDWKSFKVKYQFHDTVYHIQVVQENKKETHVSVDGEVRTGDTIPLINDERDHQVIFSLKSSSQNVVIDTSSL